MESTHPIFQMCRPLAFRISQALFHPRYFVSCKNLSDQVPWPTRDREHTWPRWTDATCSAFALWKLLRSGDLVSWCICFDSKCPAKLAFFQQFDHWCLEYPEGGSKPSSASQPETSLSWSSAIDWCVRQWSGSWRRWFARSSIWCRRFEKFLSLGYWALAYRIWFRLV